MANSHTASRRLRRGDEEPKYSDDVKKRELRFSQYYLFQTKYANP